MAAPNVLVDTTFTGKNISSAASVYEYTVAATGTFRIQVRLAAVAGNGDYVAYLTLNDGDAQTDDPMLPKTTIAAASGETAFWFSTISIDAIAGDVINIFVDGLAGDTDESGSIRIFSDNALAPTTANRTLDVTAGGEAGIDLDNTSGSLAKGTEITGFNDLAAADVRTAVGLAAANLDTQLTAIDDYLDTEVAAIKAKTDNLPADPADESNILAAIAAISAAAFPAGAVNFTYTVTDSVSGLPIEGVEVWFSTDAAGANVVWKGDTDAFGVARDVNGNLPALDAGTYRAWRQKAGYVFVDPDTEVVS